MKVKRVMFIGQAMPRKKDHPWDWPGLNKWLDMIGMADSMRRKFFFYSALVDYFPGAKNGSHLVPTRGEIEKERPRLKNDLVEFDPEIVVTVGSWSYAYCQQQKPVPLSQVVGKRFLGKPYGLVDKEMMIIPLPHPSGASTWRFRGNNQALLEKALEILRLELGQ